MSVTLDILARELMNWFGNKSDLSGKVWDNESDLAYDFFDHLKLNSSMNVAMYSNEEDVLDNSHLVLYGRDQKINEGLIAKFMIDGDKNNKELDEEISNTALKLQSNLNKDYHTATKCVVSVYSDLQNRSKFHEIEFIEIYQQYGIGCAIKRLK